MVSGQPAPRALIVGDFESQFVGNNIEWKLANVQIFGRWGAVEILLVVRPRLRFNGD